MLNSYGISILYQGSQDIRIRLIVYCSNFNFFGKIFPYQTGMRKKTDKMPTKIGVSLIPPILHDVLLIVFLFLKRTLGIVCGTNEGERRTYYLRIE